MKGLIIMKTLVIYNKINGNLLVTQSINTEIDIENNTFTNLTMEIPEGKILKSIDVSTTPNIGIFEDIPPSDIDSLKQQIADLQNYIIAKESNETTNL
jgi:hypothetical protein